MKRLVFAILLMSLSAPAMAELKERQAEVTFRINLNAPPDAKDVRLWIPYPVSDRNQAVEDVKFSGNYVNAEVYKEKEYGNSALYAEWTGASKERTLTYSFKVKRREVVAKDFPKTESTLSRDEVKEYLKGTTLGPVTGKVKETAERITKDKKTVLEKSRAIYDWIVNNMYRDPNIKGCGTGEVERLVETLGGKCGDIHSVYVALARSVGVPAREVFGIRIPKGKEGDMTKAQHCWAEFYLPGYGWVPVDPADVRKYMLENKVSDPGDIKDIVEYFFGAVNESRIAYGMGRDVTLNPPQKGEKLNYFMYPYAEVDGKALDDLFGFNLGYTITFKEIQ
jgi:transglutaminase-like putative cysteine protease